MTQRNGVRRQRVLRTLREARNEEKPTAQEVKRSQDWHKTLHQRIAQAIKDGRDDKEMTAQQLSDKTRQLGYSISRAKIANYESGRKYNLDIAELVVIAAALEIFPLQLIYPGEADRPVEILPGRTTPAYDARARFSGDRGLAAFHAQIQAIASATAKLGSRGDLRATAVPVVRPKR